MDFEPSKKLEMHIIWTGGRLEVSFTGLWMPKMIHQAQHAISKQYAFERRQIGKNYNQSKNQQKEKDNELKRREALVKRLENPLTECSPDEVMANYVLEQINNTTERQDDGRERSEQSSNGRTDVRTERRTDQADRADSSGEGSTDGTSVDIGTTLSSNGNSERPGRLKSPGNEEARSGSTSVGASKA